MDQIGTRTRIIQIGGGFVSESIIPPTQGGNIYIPRKKKEIYIYIYIEREKKNFDLWKEGREKPKRVKQKKQTDT